MRVRGVHSSFRTQWRPDLWAEGSHEASKPIEHTQAKPQTPPQAATSSAYARYAVAHKNLNLLIQGKNR